MQSMPDDFVHSFGAMLPIRIGLSCRNVMWVVKYDLQQREIIGLSKFMRYYGMKIFNMAQLDYYGEGLFVVSLFKDTALELNYPVGMPKDLNMSKEWEEQNRDDYVVRAGWREFYEAVGLKEGDYIVGFRANLEQNNKLKLCIYRAADHLNDLDAGYMYLLEDLFRDFRVKRNDTLIFKMNESDTLLCRVYDCNGMEIGYDYRPGKQATNRSPEWIWSFEQSTDRGQIELMKYAADEDNMQIDESDNLTDFSPHLTEGNVDKKMHGLFIPAISIKPQGGKWKRSQSIRLRTDKGVWIVGITVAGKKAIFCAGWNKFVRDNIYVAGQRLNLRLVDRSEPMEFEITKI
ncbi:hypothetical protein ACET3Z_031717 [Daucus carota]